MSPSQATNARTINEPRNLSESPATENFPPDNSEFHHIPVRRALISVSDKTGLADLAHVLHAANVEIVSTGSTATTIREAGYRVTEVASVTGFPEMLNGRVKTLHPAIHGGVLADLRVPTHVDDLHRHAIEPFELVVVNLYPFRETLAAGASSDEIIENIDIGGPALLRAAAKNYHNVAVVVSPDSYPVVAAAIHAGGTTLPQRWEWAATAFAHTAAYDTAIAEWFSGTLDPSAGESEPHISEQRIVDPGHDSSSGFPEVFALTGRRAAVLRYGENSHQKAALYVREGSLGVAQAQQLHGKEMSFNNYVDSDAAVRCVYDFDEPAVAIIKHANPCGVAVAEVDGSLVSPDLLLSAYQRAYACDPVSAFGGVVAANRSVTRELAEAVATVFTEVFVAPAFQEDALQVLQKKKNLRLLKLPSGFGFKQGKSWGEIRHISGGLLVQDLDTFEGWDSNSWVRVSGDEPDTDTRNELEFAWRACRSVKSNAIVLTAGRASVGIGMGQVNRLDACRLAVSRAGERAAGAVAASDAFFPFADGVQVLCDAGVRAIVQPGGSVRDEEVIDAAKAGGVLMYFTGERHFFH